MPTINSEIMQILFGARCQFLPDRCVPLRKFLDDASPSDLSFTWGGGGVRDERLVRLGPGGHKEMSSILADQQRPRI
jgi:hypothetical protein